MALKDFKHPPQLPPFIAVKDDPMSVLNPVVFGTILQTPNSQSLKTLSCLL